MACAVEAVKFKLNGLLYRANDEISIPDFEAQLVSIFTDDPIKNIGSCSCIQQEGHHQNTSIAPCHFKAPIDPAQFEPCRRLFATCIVSDRAHLMTKFLGAGYNDKNFKSATTEEEISRIVGISKPDAGTLLRAKYMFFGLNLATYLRSATIEDRPEVDERSWLLDELLEIMRKFDWPRNDREERVCRQKISSLVIRKSDATVLGRIEKRSSWLPESNMSLQALGFLIIDVLWFFCGGTSAVTKFDSQRKFDLDIILNICKPAFRFEDNPELSRAFEMAWLLIQPIERSCLPLGFQGETKYQFVYSLFRRIWPSSAMRTSLTQELRHSIVSDGASTSHSSTLSDLDYTEVSNVDEFKWIILKFRKGQGEWIGCRMRIYISKDQKTLRLNLYEYPLDSVSQSVVIADCNFVPLYAYLDGATHFDIELRAKVRTAGMTGGDIGLRFYRDADLKICQKMLTGRTIMTDTILRSFSITTRDSLKARIKIVASSTMKAEVKKWDSFGKGATELNSRRVQIWEVMDENERAIDTELEHAHVRGSQDYNLKYEIAIFRDDTLMVIGVKSTINLRSQRSSCSLRIMSEVRNESCALEGRLYTTTVGNNEEILPGLPLCQKRPFKQQHGGRVVLLESLDLAFQSGEDRDNFKNWILKMQRLPKGSMAH